MMAPDIIPADAATNPATDLRISDAAILVRRLDDARALAVPVEATDVERYVLIARGFMESGRERVRNAGAKLLMAALKYNLDRAKLATPGASDGEGSANITQINITQHLSQMPPGQREQWAEAAKLLEESK